MLDNRKPVEQLNCDRRGDTKSNRETFASPTSQESEVDPNVST